MLWDAEECLCLWSEAYIRNIYKTEFQQSYLSHHLMVTAPSLSQGVNPKTSKLGKLLYTCVRGHMYLHTHKYIYISNK